MNIMVCYDGGALSGKALEAAVERCRLLDARLSVVQAMVGGAEVPREEFQKKEEELKRIRRHWRENGIECDSVLLVQGLEPGEALVQYARENAVDEIVIGVRRRSRVGKLLFGSTAQYVILAARCPVLTVKKSSASEVPM